MDDRNVMWPFYRFTIVRSKFKINATSLVDSDSMVSCDDLQLVTGKSIDSE